MGRWILAVLFTLVANTALAQAPVAMTYAIYYTKAPAQSPAKALAEAVAQAGGNLAIVPKPTEKVDSPTVYAVLNERAQEEFKPPSADTLKYFGRGLSKQEVRDLPQARQVFVMLFAHSGKHALSALQTADKVMLEVARKTGGIPWDDETREAFSLAAWQERRIGGWDGGVPLVSRHTVIHSYRADQGVRAITLGMLKFGQPDLVVNDYSWSVNWPMGNMINATAQLIVEGAKPAAKMSIDFQQIRHPQARKSALEDQKAGAKGAAEISLRITKAEEGDPANFLLEFVFDRYPGPDRYARQEALLQTLFGSKDEIRSVRHDEAILAASAAARKNLPKLRDQFNAGFAPGAYLMLKAPFKTDDDGREWMWVEVVEWKSDRIKGRLRNDPRAIKALKAGQEVQVLQGDVFDYIFFRADGTSEGNETGRLIDASQR